MLDLSKIGALAAAAEDLTQNKVFERELPKAGVAFFVLKDYIELGRHASSNPSHKPSHKAVLIFELNHPKHMIEIEGVKEPQLFMVRVGKGSTAKSGYRKLFAAMNAAYDNKFNHFVQMIGKPFLGELFHNVVGEDDKKQTYVNADFNGAWSFKAPVQIDAITDTKTPIPIDPLKGEPRVFLWEPTGIEDDDIIGMWNSIYIEGTRDVEDKATKEVKKVSKNWIQEQIMKNLEWDNSKTQALTQEYVDLSAPSDALPADVDSDLPPSLDD
jgi:hypothetical protein